jgi:hypothetical protein
MNPSTPGAVVPAVKVLISGHIHELGSSMNVRDDELGQALVVVSRRKCLEDRGSSQEELEASSGRV